MKGSRGIHNPKQRASRLFSWLLRILFVLLSAWVIVVAGSSIVYLQGMLHPYCAAPGALPTGYQEIKLHTPDDLNLSGWWRPPENGAAILLMGGHGSNRESMLREAEFLGKAGYGALLVDGRQCAGAMTTFGYREVNDLQAMLSFARAQPEVNWIGALGFSAGGVTVLLGSGRFPEIQAVVAEGNFVNLFDEMTSSPAPVLSMEWQIQRNTALVYALMVGVWPGSVSPVDALSQISPRPVLLIHGEKEIVRTQGQRQFEAAGDPKELWVVPGAGHGEYPVLHPEEYARRIVAFFDRAR